MNGPVFARWYFKTPVEHCLVVNMSQETLHKIHRITNFICISGIHILKIKAKWQSKSMGMIDAALHILKSYP